MKLYMSERSGNAFKPRVLLEMLKVPYDKVLVDTGRKENRSASFLKINPRGEIPALEDGGRLFWDSTACLVYIARKHGGEKWLPADPAGMAEVMQWMALAQNEVRYGLQLARGNLRGSRKWGNLEELQAHGREGLKVLEGRLKDHDWLALDRPTIADLACYPYVHTAPEAGIPLDDFPAVRAWIARLEALPGWVRKSQ
jgi:glutathione S-transferase